MATPLFTLQFNLYARALALGDGTPKRLDQRFDVRERNGRRRWAREDREKGLALLGVHRRMISKSDITDNQRSRLSKAVLSLQVPAHARRQSGCIAFTRSSNVLTHWQHIDLGEIFQQKSPWVENPNLTKKINNLSADQPLRTHPFPTWHAHCKEAPRQSRPPLLLMRFP